MKCGLFGRPCLSPMVRPYIDRSLTLDHRLSAADLTLPPELMPIGMDDFTAIRHKMPGYDDKKQRLAALVRTYQVFR